MRLYRIALCLLIAALIVLSASYWRQQRQLSLQQRLSAHWVNQVKVERNARRKAETRIDTLKAQIPKKVAVLDFYVLPEGKYADTLGRDANSAVTRELSYTGRYVPFSPTMIHQRLQELGLNQPLTNKGMQTLAHALAADYVVTGDVIDASLMSSSQRARARISVRLVDTISGDLASGAIVSGYSSIPSAGTRQDEATLIRQALSDAAANAIKTINAYTLPEATIVQTRDTTEVTLNRGGRDGLTPGLEMQVIRGRNRIGSIKVTRVTATHATATVLDYGYGIRSGDQARAIFKLLGGGLYVYY